MNVWSWAGCSPGSFSWIVNRLQPEKSRHEFHILFNICRNWSPYIMCGSINLNHFPGWKLKNLFTQTFRVLPLPNGTEYKKIKKTSLPINYLSNGIQFDVLGWMVWTKNVFAHLSGLIVNNARRKIKFSKIYCLWACNNMHRACESIRSGHLLMTMWLQYSDTYKNWPQDILFYFEIVKWHLLIKWTFTDYFRFAQSLFSDLETPNRSVGAIAACRWHS